MSDEIKGLVAPPTDTLCRYRIGREVGEVFGEGDDYDGLTLTIEIDTVDQGLAFVAAICDGLELAEEWKPVKK